MIDKSIFNMTLNQKLICLLIFILGFGAVVTFDYVTWNAVGNLIINGIQGRYFIPFAPLFFLLFYGYNNIKFLNRNVILEEDIKYKLLIVESIVIILSLMIFTLVISYY